MPENEAVREEDSRAMRWERPDPGVALTPVFRNQISSQFQESIHSLSSILHWIPMTCNPTKAESWRLGRKLASKKGWRKKQGIWSCAGTDREPSTSLGEA